MAIKRTKPEEIVTKLRQVEVLVGQGKTRIDAIRAVGAKTAYITPVSRWENGYCESFNARFRDELLNGEIFYTLKEAQIIIEQWRKHYNTKRPHSALGYRSPAPGGHRPDGPRTGHALTFKLDHSMGANHIPAR